MRFIVARPGACEKVALGSPQGYVKVSQVKQTKQEQISTGYFENDSVGWEREWEDFRRADKGEGIGSALGAAGRAGGDRKSTRLNSSHDQISYAVVCLKQKAGT